MECSSSFTSWMFLCLVVAMVTLASRVEARAFFVFGDSLVHNGNNKYLATSARADSPPYGIDYPSHRPTGRFSNGLNIPDLISEQMGAESTLPYLSPELTGQRLLVGVNFASAGVGVLNDTGIQFIEMIADAIDDALDDDEAEEKIEDLTNQPSPEAQPLDRTLFPDQLDHYKRTWIYQMTRMPMRFYHKPLCLSCVKASLCMQGHMMSFMQV